MPLQRSDGTEPALIEILFSMMPDVFAPAVACKLQLEESGELERVHLSLEVCTEVLYCDDSGSHARERAAVATTQETSSMQRAPALEEPLASASVLLSEQPMQQAHTTGGLHIHEDIEGEEETFGHEHSKLLVDGNKAGPLSSGRISQEALDSESNQQGVTHKFGLSRRTEPT
jgi:hypothetical protein